MLDFSNFIVRNSGRGTNTFYLDCGGLYHVSDIASVAGLPLEKLDKIYSSNGGSLNGELDVYYFNDIEKARRVIKEIFSLVEDSNKGKSVYFSEEEIGYLRKALINDASGFAGNSSRMVDAILKKLNR